MLGLLERELAPITDEIAFFEAEPEAVRDWLVKRSADNLLRVREVNGDLRQALKSLLPLVLWSSRFLVAPTRSPWTAYFDNTVRGTDSGGLTGALAEDLGCRGVRMVAAPTVTDNGQLRQLGGTIFTLYDSDRHDWLNLVRNVHAIDEGERWVFDTSGTPQPFEEIDAYSAPRIADRFTPSMLGDYLAALGINAFDEDFYLPNRRVYLVEETAVIGNREFTLEEARARM